MEKSPENTLAEEVLSYLNHRTGREFKTIKGTGLLQRIQEGRTMEDFKAVIDLKTSKWLKDPKMSEYLRPSTLFGETNFENYFQETKSGAKVRLEPIFTGQPQGRDPSKPNYDPRLFDPLEDFLKGNGEHQ